MKLMRVDSDKSSKEVQRINIEIDGRTYRLTECQGRLEISSPYAELSVIPRVTNVIHIVSAEKDDE